MTTKTKVKPETFRRSVTKNEPDQGWRAELHEENSRGWAITAIRMPYYGQELCFIEFNHPDGTSSYMRLDSERPATETEAAAYFAGHKLPSGIAIEETPEGLSVREFRAGPFGGGYSWALPKYVVEAGERLAREAFKKEKVET